MVGSLDAAILERLDTLSEVDRRIAMIDLIDKYAGSGVPLSPALRRVFVEQASKAKTSTLRRSLVEAMEMRQAELAEMFG